MQDWPWPPEHLPEGAAIHVRNALAVEAPAEAVWRWLVRCDLWHRYYPNAWRVRVVDGPAPLRPGTRFRWITFGVPVSCRVEVCEPPTRLAWSGIGLGAKGYHWWEIEPAEAGCTVATEETQRGLAPRLLRPVLRPALRALHQRWLEGLARVARAGPPPS